MRINLTVLLTTLAFAGAAHAGSQSSNTSSNSSSNNGVARDRVVDTYCEDGYCTTTVHRRVNRDDRGARRSFRSDETVRYAPYQRYDRYRQDPYPYRRDDD